MDAGKKKLTRPLQSGLQQCTPLFLHLITCPSPLHKKKRHSNLGKMVLWDTNPLSQSAGFPNKSCCLLTKHLSLSGLTYLEMSSRNLDSERLVHFELTNSGHILKPVRLQVVLLLLSRSLTLSPVWPALQGSNFKSHSENYMVRSHLSREKWKEDKCCWAMLSHGGYWLLEACLVHLRCDLRTKYTLDFKGSIFSKVSYLNFYINYMLITLRVYWVKCY